eukprot:4499311-Pyramimonas_sp.AAC.1
MHRGDYGSQGHSQSEGCGIQHDGTAATFSTDKLGKGTVHIFYASVTSYIEKVKHYIEHADYEVIGLAEHHLLARAIKVESQELRRHGWQSQFTWAPATPTRTSVKGARGGT